MLKILPRPHVSELIPPFLLALNSAKGRVTKANFSPRKREKGRDERMEEKRSESEG
jgi:hypothetical protein